MCRNHATPSPHLVHATPHTQPRGCLAPARSPRDGGLQKRSDGSNRTKLKIKIKGTCPPPWLSDCLIIDLTGTCPPLMGKWLSYNRLERDVTVTLLHENIITTVSCFPFYYTIMVTYHDDVTKFGHGSSTAWLNLVTDTLNVITSASRPR